MTLYEQSEMEILKKQNKLLLESIDMLKAEIGRLKDEHENGLLRESQMCQVP